MHLPWEVVGLYFSPVVLGLWSILPYQTPLWLITPLSATCVQALLKTQKTLIVCIWLANSFSEKCSLLQCAPQHGASEQNGSSQLRNLHFLLIPMRWAEQLCSSCTWSLLSDQGPSAGTCGTSSWGLTASAWLPTQPGQASVVSLCQAKWLKFSLWWGLLWLSVAVSFHKEGTFHSCKHFEKDNDVIMYSTQTGVVQHLLHSWFCQLNGTGVLNSMKLSIWVTSQRLPHCFPSAFPCFHGQIHGQNIFCHFGCSLD